jgi:CRP-like cAMP-binding protein
MPHSAPVPSGLHAILASDAWFASCPLAFQDALLSLARLWVLGDGETLFARGAAAQGLCCVVAGVLHIGSVAPDGSATLLACVEPYQWFGEVSLIDDQPRTHDAVAVGETKVLVVPQAALRDWLAEQPAMWRDVGRLACGKLRTAFTVLENMVSLPLEQRLLRHLELVARGYGMRTGSARQRIRLPQEQLALMLGVSRQSVNKALRTLESRGAIALRYGQIELLASMPD